MNVFNALEVKVSEVSYCRYSFDFTTGKVSDLLDDGKSKTIAVRLSIVEQGNAAHNVLLDGILGSSNLEVDFGDLTNPEKNFIGTGILTIWTNQHMISIEVFVPQESRRAVATALCAPDLILDTDQI